MIKKKRTPWGIFFLLLVVVLIIAYYMSGLYKMEGVTFDNYQEKFFYILSHPFYNWMNDMTTPVMQIAFVGWLMAVCYYLTYHRDFHPDKEHGVDEWADIRKTGKKLYFEGK